MDALRRKHEQYVQHKSDLEKELIQQKSHYESKHNDLDRDHRTKLKNHAQQSQVREDSLNLALNERESTIETLNTQLAGLKDDYDSCKMELENTKSKAQSFEVELKGKSTQLKHVMEQLEESRKTLSSNVENIANLTEKNKKAR